MCLYSKNEVESCCENKGLDLLWYDRGKRGVISDSLRIIGIVLEVERERGRFLVFAPPNGNDQAFIDPLRFTSIPIGYHSQIQTYISSI